MPAEAELLGPCNAEELVPEGRYPLSEHAGGPQSLSAIRMDRHLVTVDRYLGFVKAGGYQTREHWSEAGWAWRERTRATGPRFVDQPEWSRFMRSTRPIVGISWFEAEAFCRSEGRRLPTEAEWEAAARGLDGHSYPWGESYDPRCAGMRGHGPRVTWPTGYFRRGRGPFGHFDLVGNVWQWTATVSSQQGGRPQMVVKGGSWASRPDQGRTGFFNVYEAGVQHSHVGFRTVAQT